MASRVKIRVPTARITVPLATGAVAYQGETAGAITGTHTCDEISSVSDMKTLGTFVEDYDETAGDVNAQIDLFAPFELEYYPASGTSAPVLATDFLGKAYFEGDTITTAAIAGGVNLAFAGIIYDVDSKDGVGIKPVNTELAELLS